MMQQKNEILELHYSYITVTNADLHGTWAKSGGMA
jgi:hypothetical protein